MPRYLISFPSPAMVVRDDEWGDVSDAAHAVVDEMRAAGVYVTSGGLRDDVEPTRVAGDGSVSDELYPQTRDLSGGMAIIEVPSREEAHAWAAKLAVACRCPQEVREFQHDPLA